MHQICWAIVHADLIRIVRNGLLLDCKAEKYRGVETFCSVAYGKESEKKLLHKEK